MKRLLAVLPLFLVIVVCRGVSQTPGTVDYARDIQPLLRQNCVGCHGPTKQSGGLRLDRRSSAMKSQARRIVAGNSANSMVYHRVTGSEYGAQMPPTGDLRPELVATLKNWIEQGAQWPDELANEVELPPLNGDAVAAVAMLNWGDVSGFMKTVAAKPGLLNARGPEGSTPFMYAVLYTNPTTVARLLRMGAEVNARNDANATALMWGVHDVEMARLLLAHKADVNVMSDSFRTALMIAARRPGGAPVVKLLLEHGANPNPNARPETASSPLLEAATAGDATSFELLMQHGAVLKGDAEPTLVMAVIMDCDRCVDLAVEKITDTNVYTSALQDTAFLGKTKQIRMMLDHGADPKAYDVFGHTALMYAAASDVLPVDAVKLLVSRGADVNAKSKRVNSGDSGRTVLDLAKMHGQTPVLEYLVAAGAKDGGLVPVALKMRSNNGLRSAIKDSLPLVQQADVQFAKNSGCVSCHNNSLTAMTVGMARKQGFAVDEKVAASQVEVNVDSIAKIRDQLHQGYLLPIEDNFSEGVVAYILLGLDAEGYKADLNTDAAAMHILWRQKPNGEWQQPHADTRQPLCLNYIGQTALSMRALQLYSPKANAAAFRKSIQMAANWLATAKSYNNDDRSWRVSGLAWAGNNEAAKLQAVRELESAQKGDGGWSDLPTMESTAYATGKSLVALHIAGVSVSEPVYRRGVDWLLKHQQEDGSWFVQTRALAFQPWSDSGFPHQYDQFISAAGTNWAAMALTAAVPEVVKQVASRGTAGLFRAIR